MELGQNILLRCDEEFWEMWHGHLGRVFTGWKPVPRGSRRLNR